MRLTCNYSEVNEDRDTYSITLSALSQENSENLLLNICPRINNNATRLSRICRYNPLNLCLIAGYLNYASSIKVDDFIFELEEN